MSSEIPQWNPVQFVLICMYTCWLSFFQSPNGGLSVVAIYISLVVLGIPTVFVQLKLGGYLQQSLLLMLTKFFPIWKGFALMALVDLFILLVTYAPLVAQLGTYAFISVLEGGDEYIWGTCDSSQFLTTTSEVCTIQPDLSYAGKVARRPEVIFYTRQFLEMSDSIEDAGGFPNWRFTEMARKADISLMPVTLAVVWVLVALSVAFGARRCGWVLFVIGLGALGCLLTILGYGYHHLDTKLAMDYLRNLYKFRDEDDDHILTIWTDNFKLLTYTFPLWTAICCTMGKLCGRSRKLRNLTWLMLMIVFLLVSQLPNIAMAPYLGGLYKAQANLVRFSTNLERLMTQMPAAFTVLQIPKAYACVFFSSAFLFSFMFLCVGTLTIVDNIMDSMKHSGTCGSCGRITISIFVTLIITVVALGFGCVQTMKVGHYVFLLITQSLDKLRYPYIFLLGIGILVVYVKQNFGLMERIVMGCWFSVSCIVCSAMWQYDLYEEWDKHSNRIKYDSLSWPREGYFPGDGWTLVSWVIAAVPYLAVLVGIVQACFFAVRGDEDGGSNSCCRKLCCGINQRVRNHGDPEFAPPPLLPSEPSAPPYMYSYVENGGAGHGDAGYPMDQLDHHHHHHSDHYKLDYDMGESEPLAPQHHGRATRI